MTHKSRIGNIVIDCNTQNLKQQAIFWSKALGCKMPEKVRKDDKFIQLKTKGGELQIILQAVSHPSGMHLDIETNDIQKEVRRMRNLGAEIVIDKSDWVVMQSPSGHRFCIGKAFRGGFEDNANVWD